MEKVSLRFDNGLKLQMPDADIPERQRRAGEVMFADMISMGDMAQTEDFTVDVMDEAVSSVQTDALETRKENSTDAYEKYQYKDKTIRAEEKAVSEQDTEKVEAELAEFAEDVTEVIQEELHVSKEEIEAAMEELGLTFVDLLDAGNLANLVAKLSGNENTNQLLCSEVFTNIMQEVNALGAELFEELQMTPEELEFIQQELAKVETVAESVSLGHDAEAGKIVEATETVADDVTVVKQPVATDEAMQNTDTANVEDVVKEVSTNEDFSGQMNDSEETFADTEENALYADKKTVAQTAETPIAEAKVDGTTVSMDSMVAGTADSQFGTAEAAQGLPSYVSVSDILEQFAEHTRVFVSQEATKMEMQLNPEHLGKLYVEITEQEGSITAKIQTQNAIVKEALEMQLADLRQNLTQAGVKVDAVEVTIASHEFERNLEQDANSQKQQEDAQPKTSRMRNINLNELDGLSGLMTEEETIVAKMMAEQGNSVNFTA